VSDSTRRGLGLIAGAIALGIAGDGLLRAWPWGLNVPFWTIALGIVVAAITQLVRPRVTLHPAGLLLVVPALIFAASIAWRDSMALFTLNLLGLILCLALVAGLLAITLLDAVNPDGLIAQNNLARTGAPQPLDSRYLASLSADAVPALIEGLSTLQPSEQQRLVAALAARWPSRTRDWRTWNWSRDQAALLLTDSDTIAIRMNPAGMNPERTDADRTYREGEILDASRDDDGR